MKLLTKFIANVKAKLNNIEQKIYAFCVAIFFATPALAQGSSALLNLPITGLFCQIAKVLQGQWAPGILMILIIVEALLFLVVKKGILQMLMATVVGATIIFSAGSLLKMIAPTAATCL